MDIREKTTFLKLLELKDLNEELLDVNYNLTTRLIQEYRKHQMNLEPEIEGLLQRVRQVLIEISEHGKTRHYTSHDLSSSTESKHDKHYRQGNRTCIRVL